MSASPGNQFIFRHSRHLPKVTALNAVMRDFHYEKHAHEEMALGVTLAGRQDFICKGTGFKSPPGHILLFNPEDVHDGCPGDKTTLKYTMLYIPPEQLAPLMGRPAGRIPDTLFYDPLLKAHILSLARLISSGGGGMIEEEWHLLRIANHLAKRLKGSKAARAARGNDPLLLRAKDYIHDNLESELSIDELCKVANISKYNFIRLFRGRFGITPHKYVLNCRVNRAREELGKGIAPSEAAQMAGFADVSHLNRNFKRIYGTTPKRYQTQFTR